MTRQAERGVILRQLLRYGLVGLGSNLVLYLAYLLLTGLGTGPTLAMSLLYLAGILQTFFFNKLWTFGHDGPGTRAFQRYLLLYALGYAINWLLMQTLVVHMNLPHQAVMAGLLVLMAIFFFAGQKYWVFRAARQESRP